MPAVPDFPYTLPLSIYDESTKANIPNPAWISVLEQLRGLVSAAVNKQTDQAGVIFEYQSATECRLKVKGSGLVPLFYRGDLIQVDIGQTANGYVSFSNSGLSANTRYYAYAYYDPGTATVKGEWSTTGHATTSGVETKSGDQTRSLVGMVYTGGSTPGNFQDSETARLVRTWYNDPGIFGFKAFGSNYTTTSASYVEISSSERLYFIAWESEVISASHHATVQNSAAAGTAIFSALGLNGTVYSQSIINSKGAAQNENIATSWALEVSPSATPDLNEGDLQYFSVYGAVTAGTGTWSTTHTALSYTTNGKK